MHHPMIHPSTANVITNHDSGKSVDCRSFHFSTDGSNNLSYTIMATNGALVVCGDVEDGVFNTYRGNWLSNLQWAAGKTDLNYLLSKSSFKKSFAGDQTAKHVRELYEDNDDVPDEFDSPEHLLEWLEYNNLETGDWYEMICTDYGHGAYAAALALSIGADRSLSIIDNEKFEQNPYEWADEQLFMDNQPLVNEWTALSIQKAHRVDYAKARKVASLFLKSLHWRYPSTKFDRTKSGCEMLVLRSYHAINDIKVAICSQ